MVKVWKWKDGYPIIGQAFIENIPVDVWRFKREIHLDTERIKFYGKCNEKYHREIEFYHNTGVEEPFSIITPDKEKIKVIVLNFKIESIPLSQEISMMAWYQIGGSGKS